MYCMEGTAEVRFRLTVPFDAAFSRNLLRVGKSLRTSLRYEASFVEPLLMCLTRLSVCEVVARAWYPRGYAATVYP